jgi:CelD/BcsL family acetyltransferase involved in cellulose biosynthesis
VLQLEATRLLAAEGRYTRLDFTEGEGQHKRQFGTGGIACADVLLFRPTIANRLLIASVRGFDGLAALAKGLSTARGFGWLKRLRR